MLPYNTHLPKISLPEYGRQIQSLVEFCLTIPDRDERTACAYAIADTMCTLFPETAADADGLRKIWDQMNIISGFKLDVDFPFPVITEENANPKPNKVPYSASRIHLRHYGKHIEDMVQRVADMENNDEKDMLVFMIANHMKKLMVMHNKENATDAKVFRDLAELSQGAIVLDPNVYTLNEYQDDSAPKNENRKKKKKKK